MLAQRGTTLRREQDLILSKIMSQQPTVVCEAELPLLISLAGGIWADTILPAGMLSPAQQSAALSFDPPVFLSLVLAVHPGRKLPKTTDHLLDAIRKTFRDQYW